MFKEKDSEFDYVVSYSIYSKNCDSDNVNVVIVMKVGWDGDGIRTKD